MEQSVFGLEQHGQSYKTFYNLFLVKNCKNLESVEPESEHFFEK